MHLQAVRAGCRFGDSVMACLLWNEPASYARLREVKGQEVRSRSESESEQGARVDASRPETA
jgi:hypothetical protein